MQDINLRKMLDVVHTYKVCTDFKGLSSRECLSTLMLKLNYVSYYRTLEHCWLCEDIFLTRGRKALAQSPDGAFHNFRTSRLGDGRNLCSSGTSSDGFWSFFVKRSVGLVILPKILSSRFEKKNPKPHDGNVHNLRAWNPSICAFSLQKN